LANVVIRKEFDLPANAYFEGLHGLMKRFSLFRRNIWSEEKRKNCLLIVPTRTLLLKQITLQPTKCSLGT